MAPLPFAGERPVTLRTFLTDWTDIDVAAHELARCLGVLPDRSRMSDAKWVYWSNGALGDELVVLLDRLVALGVLEKRDEPDYQYRVSTQFEARLGIEGIWQRLARSSPPRLSLVVIRCANVARSRQFYAALGIVSTVEQHGSGPQHYSADLGGVVLELYPSTAATSPIRLGLDVADVEAAVTAARALDADCVIRFEPEQEPLSAVIRDPDGNTIELTTQPA
jgi:catechol 2,3-dioxygenase-like lactoylglutathione lyase family enzyme